MNPLTWVGLKDPHKARVRRGAGYVPRTWRKDAEIEGTPECDKEAT